MSGDHNQYQKPEYVDRRQWKYDPMTGRSLKKPDDISPWENYCYERGYFHALEVARQTSQREWQGLTNDEREKATGWSVEHIEAKLKEKNTL
jgi:hypothetical protein